MKYDAFISYRHAPLDMEIAKKVHTGLETYKIPRSVQKKTGIKKISRVFRDQEELPIGSNLSDNISDALKVSEFLVVICSPRTPESEWVRKEIDTFIELHGRDRVLAVLIEGEPDESFPPRLVTDEAGNPVEPLAADVRGSTKKERNTKFKTEILRLVAPILHCTYDDLKQRHRERVIKRAMTIGFSIASVFAAAGIAFGIYNANVADKMSKLATEKANLAEDKTQLAEEKTQLAEEILQEFRQKQENQSRFYAKEALSLLSEGEREDAALIAMAALPSENNDRPYVAEAEYALAQILHAYDIGNDMTYDRTLEHDLTVYDMKLSNDRKFLAVRDSGCTVYVYDTETWELKGKFYSKLNKNYYTLSVEDQYADETGVVIAGDDFLYKLDYDGNELFSMVPEGYLRNVYAIDDIMYIVTSTGISRIDKNSGEFFGHTEVTGGKFFSRSDVSTDDKYIYASFSDENDERTDLAVYDIANDRFVRLKSTEPYVMESCYTPSGNIATLSCQNDFFLNGLDRIVLDVFEAETGKKLASTVVDAHIKNLSTFDTKMKAHTYENDEGEKAEIVVAIESEAFTYNERDLKLVQNMTLPGAVVKLNLRSDNSIGFVSMDNGVIDTIDFAEGRIYSDNTINTDKPIRDVIIMNGVVVIRSAYSSTVNVMKYHKAADLQDFDIGTGFMSVVSPPDANDRFIAKCSDNYIVYSGDCEFRFDFRLDETYHQASAVRGDEFLLFTANSFYEIGKEAVKTTYESLGITSRLSHFYVSANGRYAAGWGTRDIAVIDTVEKKKIFEVSTEVSVGNVAVSEAGDKVYVSLNDRSLICVDVATNEDKMYENEKLRGLADFYSLNYVVVSHDGKHLAMCCSDGTLRVIDTKNGDTVDEIPMHTKLRCGVFFTNDDSKLIIQGDDLKVKIRDIAEHDYVNAFDVAYTIKNMTESDDFIAIQDGVNEYLIEKSGYGLCTEVDYGLAYLPGKRTFIISRINTLYKSQYKDYKELLAEAEKQFPGAELTDEERVKYNVN